MVARGPYSRIGLPMITQATRQCYQSLSELIRRHARDKSKGGRWLVLTHGVV